FPKIAIIGAGAIGTYYGAKLALAGNDVRFLLRSDLAWVRASGLRLIEKTRTLSLQSAAVYDSADEIGLVDLVFVTLKATANGELPRLLPPLLCAGTVVVTLQNGLGNEEWLASIVGAERAAGGLCFIAATRTAPGEVTCYHPGTITLGEIGRPAEARTQAIAELFNRAGVKCTAVDNLDEARWRKLVWNIPFNGLAIAAGGIATDRICADAELAAETRALMSEVQAAAAKFGYSISDNFLHRQFDVTPSMGAYQPSSLIDFLAGREVEVEAIWGEPLRRAQAAGASVPRLDHLYRILKKLTAR
ncbi:MAG: 2-dehydropantoate 2-reductase, partial [Verrucomicrobiota bacterium]|nr:2-dehydropantoate 2-reductase [Verrucomicrobiota bacterium]